MAELRAARGAAVAFFAGLNAEELLRQGTANQRTYSVRAVAYVAAGHERHHGNIIRERYLPNRTLTVLDPSCGEPLPSLLQGKAQVDGRPTVYICHNMTCSPPVTAWAEVERLLGG